MPIEILYCTYADRYPSGKKNYMAMMLILQDVYAKAHLYIVDASIITVVTTSLRLTATTVIRAMNIPDNIYYVLSI